MSALATPTASTVPVTPASPFQAVCSIPGDAPWRDEALQLLAACKAGDVAAVKAILTTHHPDLDLNATGSDGNTALLLAVQIANEALMRTLLEQDDVDVNKGHPNTGNALVIICGKNQTSLAKLLMEMRGPAYTGKYPLDINAVGPLGGAALILAALNNNMEVAKLALSHPKVNVNLARTSGYTALLVAAEKGSMELTSLLLERADIDTEMASPRMGTALDSAVRFRNWELAALLKKKRECKCVFYVKWCAIYYLMCMCV